MTYEQIWAPWRLTYVQGDKSEPAPSRPLTFLSGADSECFLCQNVAATWDCEPDRERGVVRRRSSSIVVLNRYPYNNGHLLVAPCRHVGRLDELTPDEEIELTRTITKMVGLLEKVLHPHGFNIGLNLGQSAGAGLPGHLHWHIVPRWNGDTNFMPILANVNVIPQSLDALWDALTNA